LQTCGTPPVSPTDTGSYSNALDLVGPKLTPTNETKPFSLSLTDSGSKSNASNLVEPKVTPTIKRNSTSLYLTDNGGLQSNTSDLAEPKATPANKTKSILKYSPGENVPISQFSWIETAKSPHQPDLLMIKPPRFIVYKDAELVNREKAGGINKIQIDRLIRTSITNMQTELSLREYPRTPTDEELTEMAKALTITYPTLLDDLDSCVSYDYFIPLENKEL